MYPSKHGDFMGFQWDFMGFHGISWDFMGFMKIADYLQVLHGLTGSH